MRRELTLFLLALFTSGWLSAQTYKWGVSEGGPDYLEFGLSVDVDDEGNTYMTGLFYNNAILNDSMYFSQGLDDMVIIKYDPFGDAEWVKVFQSTSPDRGTAIHCGPDNHVYLSGHGKFVSGWGPMKTTLHSRDATMIRLRPDGTVVWQHAVDGDVYSEALDVVADAQGNSLFTGLIRTEGYFNTDTIVGNGMADVYLCKFDPAGNITLLTSFGGAGEDEPFAVETDAAGNMYVAGYYSAGIDFAGDSLRYRSGTEAFLVKLSPTGVPLWGRGFYGGGNDRIDGMQVTPEGDIYFAGRFAQNIIFGSDTLNALGDDFFIAKYDSLGNQVWLRQGSAPGSEYTQDIQVDDQENLYVCGFYFGAFAYDTLSATNGGGEDAWFLKLDSTGAPIFLETLNGINTEYFFDLAVDKARNVYLTGSYIGTLVLGPDSLESVNTTHDIFTTKFGFPLEINFDSLTGTPYCYNDAFEVHYSVWGSVDNGNVFIAELSDAAGSFASATQVGQATDVLCGTIVCTLPGGVPAGSGYRVRVRSTAAPQTSVDNGYDITIIGNSALPISITGDTLLCPGDSVELTAAAGFASYMWSTGDTTMSIWVNAVGTYEVEGTDSGGCSNSATVDVLPCVGIAESQQQAMIRVYPNPSNGSFWVDYGAQGPPCDEIRLFGLDGREVYTSFICPDSATRFKLEVNGISSGLYFLAIPHQDGTVFRRIMIGGN